MATEIGIVKIVIGNVVATAADGATRTLLVGDKLFADEVITTGATGAIDIEFTDGSSMSLGRNSSAMLDNEVFDPQLASQTEADVDADVAALQQALLDGTDPTEAGEATAAGAGTEGGEEGHSSVTVEYLAPEAEVTSGFETTGVENEFPPILEEEIAVLNEPVVSVSVQVQIDVEDPNDEPPTGDPTPENPVTVSGNAANILEGTNGEEGRDVTFVLSLDKVFDQDVTVTYQLAEGTAAHGANEDWFNGGLIQTVVIPAGTTEFPVTVTIVQDHFDEGNEDFSIIIIDAVNATVNPDSNTAVVTIFDDDTTPVANADTNWVQAEAAPIFDEEEQEPFFIDQQPQQLSTGPIAAGNVLNDNDHTYDPDAEIVGDEVAFQDAADTDEDGDSIVVTAVTAHGVDGSLGGGDDTVGVVGSPLAGAYGTLTLLSNGNYSYEAGPETSELTRGEQVEDQFTYTVTDTYNQPQTTTLTITIFGGDSGVEIQGINGRGSDLIVDEDDLPAGSDQGDSTTDTGTFTVVAPDGVDTVTIGGNLIISNGVLINSSFNTALGNTFEVTNYDDATGIISYQYTLNANTTTHAGSGEDSVTESFDVILTDTDGDSSATDGIDSFETITVTVTDDVPTAVDDATSQGAEDSDVVYNVLTNDTQGADSATLTAAAVRSGNGSGSVTFLSNGQVTYDPLPGEVGTVLIDYTITDSDGDTSDATLTITLGSDSSPQPGSDSSSVDEAGLAVVGSSAGDGSDSTGGNVAFNLGNDSFASVSLDGQGTYGTFTLSDAGVWTYTLSGAMTDVNQAGTAETDSVTYTVTDSDGSTGQGTLTVTIVDDVPSAITPEVAYVINTGSDSDLLVPLDFDMNVDDNYGADQAGTVTFANIAVSGTDSGQTAGGSTIYLYTNGTSIIGSTLVSSTYAAAIDVSNVANKVFTVDLNLDGDIAITTDSYSVTMFQQLDGAVATFDTSDGIYDIAGGNTNYNFYTDTTGVNPTVLITPTENGTSVNTSDKDIGIKGDGGGLAIGDNETVRVSFIDTVSGTPLQINYVEPADHIIGDNVSVNGAIVTLNSKGSATTETGIFIRAYDDVNNDNIVSDGSQDDITKVVVAGLTFNISCA